MLARAHNAAHLCIKRILLYLSNCIPPERRCLRIHFAGWLQLNKETTQFIKIFSNRRRSVRNIFSAIIFNSRFRICDATTIFHDIKSADSQSEKSRFFAVVRPDRWIRRILIDAEDIYRSRACWTNVEKRGGRGNKTARAKRTEVNNGGEGVVGAMRRPQSTIAPRGYTF